MERERCLRNATEVDIPYIVRLHEREHVRKYMNPPSELLLREGLKNDRYSHHVLECNGQPAGFLVLEYPENWLAELKLISVEEPGRGLGSFMMKWAVDHAFYEKFVRRISLEVLSENERARRLYERAGFSFEGTFRKGFMNKTTGHFSDLCVYGLLVDDPGVVQ